MTEGLFVDKACSIWLREDLIAWVLGKDIPHVQSMCRAGVLRGADTRIVRSAFDFWVQEQSVRQVLRTKAMVERFDSLMEVALDSDDYRWRVEERDERARARAEARAKLEISVHGALLKDTVYFIRQDGSDPIVKIGFTTNLRKRLSDLQHANGQKLTVLATLDGPMALEKQLHSRFAHLRLRREWFRLEGELAEYIKTLPPYEEPTA